MELITTGLSNLQRRARSDLRREVMKLVEQSGSSAPARMSDLLRALNDQSSTTVTAEELGAVMEGLQAEGAIVISGTGSSRNVKKLMNAPSIF